MGPLGVPRGSQIAKGFLWGSRLTKGVTWDPLVISLKLTEMVATRLQTPPYLHREVPFFVTELCDLLWHLTLQLPGLFCALNVIAVHSWIRRSADCIVANTYGLVSLLRLLMSTCLCVCYAKRFSQTTV
uniref:G-protein coupled receptors family 1 profile domain-containing protein n=1 Tax=Trichuris muris TaxID=70415 RepID=A0A5S6QMF7_TRIMR